MSFEVLEQFSLPGDPAKPNEDALAHLDRAALVLDGATPLGPALLPGPSDAAWIAQFGARRLAAHLKDGDDAKTALKHALADAEKSFAGLARGPVREKWQTPCASMMMVAERLGRDPSPPRVRSTLAGEMPVAGPRASEGQRGSNKMTERLGRDPSPPRTRSVLAGEMPVAGSRASEGQRGQEFLWFGDCAAIVEQNGRIELFGDTIERRRAEAARARKMALELKLPTASGIDRKEIQSLLRAARNRINSGSNWLFSPDRRAAAHAKRGWAAVEDGALMLIASDGFLALVSDYGAYDTAGLMAAARQKGLVELGKELRAIETGDALAEEFPRFKINDDATAILLRVSAAH